jgi:hypothetical protein
VPPEDRWAIVAYIRALQLSQHAPVDALPADLRRRLDASAAASAPPLARATADARTRAAWHAEGAPQ